MLKEIFIELAGKFSNNTALIDSSWEEIRQAYSESHRHYHNLSHLHNLVTLLNEVSNEIGDWEMVLFAVFYHDIIYRSTSKKNEEKSAALARHRLMELGIEPGRVEKCCRMILATKAHTQAGDSDTDYFTDADLSILGQSTEVYTAYYKQVRKEYFIYPDFVYNPGRKKVLQHFLQMNPIFKTDYFFNKFEAQAKQNLIKEMEML